MDRDDVLLVAQQHFQKADLEWLIETAKQFGEGHPALTLISQRQEKLVLEHSIVTNNSIIDLTLLGATPTVRLLTLLPIAATSGLSLEDRDDSTRLEISSPTRSIWYKASAAGSREKLRKHALAIQQRLVGGRT